MNCGYDLWFLLFFVESCLFSRRDIICFIIQLSINKWKTFIYIQCHSIEPSLWLPFNISSHLQGTPHLTISHHKWLLLFYAQLFVNITCKLLSYYHFHVNRPREHQWMICLPKTLKKIFNTRRSRFLTLLAVFFISHPCTLIVKSECAYCIHLSTKVFPRCWTNSGITLNNSVIKLVMHFQMQHDLSTCISWRGWTVLWYMHVHCGFLLVHVLIFHFLKQMNPYAM